MEEKDTKNSDGALPPYSPSPNTKQPKKKWIMGVSMALLFALIVVVSSLVGAYMTQKHTETMITLTLSSQDGHNTQQTILVNEHGEVAVFIVLINKSSSTIVFDYKRKIIGIRTFNNSICYLLRMEEVQSPSIPEILKMMRNFQSNSTPPSKKFTYTITPIEEANLLYLGINLNILCSDVPVYWSKMITSFTKRKQSAGDPIIIKRPDGTVIIIT